MTGRLHRLPWLYSTVLAMRLSPVGRALHERAERVGVQLRIRPWGIRVTRQGRDIWFSLSKASELWTLLEDFPGFEQRLVFEPAAERPVADCRGPSWYRLLRTGDRVRLPALPETVDFAAGYLLRGEPPEGAVVFDAGAFCGEMTIVFARLVGERGRVFAFEPDPGNAEYLEANVAAAGLQNVVVVRRGLWSRACRLSFQAGAGLSSQVAEGGSGRVEAEMLSLRDAAELAGGPPDFVKMDIEGAEVEAIEGSLEFIAEHRMRFAVASYHLREGRPTSTWIEPLFRRAGYQADSGFPEHRTTWAWKA